VSTTTDADMAAALDLVLTRLQALSSAFDKACPESDEWLAAATTKDERRERYYAMERVYDMRGFVVSDALDCLTKLRNKGMMTGDIDLVIGAVLAGAIDTYGDGAR
jgi:hypothetical protein